jgi:hypothetical protein
MAVNHPLMGIVNGKIIYMVQVCLEGGVAHYPNMEIH